MDGQHWGAAVARRSAVVRARPVTLPGLTEAFKGESLSAQYKLRVLREVVRIAEQKRLAAP